MSGSDVHRARGGADSGRVLHIDWTTCDARGICIELLEGRVMRDPWGYPVVPHAGSDLPLADGDLEAAAEAVALCPRLALTIEPRRA